MASLQWADISFDASRPVIHLRAGTTKSRRADVVPLRTDLAGELGAAKSPFARPTDRVFRTTPTRATFRRDCDRAGIRWQADERGRTLDRHALRTTFVTWLSVAGVEPRTAQELARHTDLKLTMQNYTDPKLINLWGAIERLPAIRQAAVTCKTGTDDAEGFVPPVVPNLRESPRNEAHQAPGAESTTLVSAIDSATCSDVRDHSLSDLNGGGGNRTPVPRHFGPGFYVRSRSIGSRRRCRRSTGFTIVQPDCFLARVRPSSEHEPAF